MSGIVGDNIAGASGIVKGTVAVENLAADPAILPGDTWTSSSNVNTKRQQCAGFGIQGAAVVVGGANPTALQSTEEYDGSTWTTVNNYLSATWVLSSNGILSAGLAAGGQNPSYTTQCGEYDGTSWTAGGSLVGAGARGYMAQCGTLSAGLCCGGTDGTVYDNTEEYNGSSWAAANNMTARKESLGAAGIQTACISFGGNYSGLKKTTENYDGTSWSAAINMNNAKSRLMGAGTSTAAMAIGGWDAVGLTQLELWNGTGWGAASHLLVARYYGGACGFTSNAVAFAGESSGSTGSPAPVHSGPLNSTEEYQGGSGGTAGKVWYNTSEGRLKLSSNAGVWVSGGNMVSTLNNRGSAGGTSAGLSFVGEPTSALCEAYDGTTWSATNSMTASKTYASGCGTQGSALLSGSVNTSCYEYNGLSWAGGGTLATERTYAGVFGDLIAAVVVGNSAYASSSEEYDGTAWAAGGAYPLPIGYGKGLGTLSAGMYGTGYNNIAPFMNDMATYDGTAWTIIPHANTRRYYCFTSARGTISAATIAGGQAAGLTALSLTEEYNGTSWATARNMLIGRIYGSFGGTQSDMFAAGGGSSTGAAINSTEEYSIGTTSFNAIVNLT